MPDERIDTLLAKREALWAALLAAIERLGSATEEEYGERRSAAMAAYGEYHAHEVDVVNALLRNAERR